MKKLIIILAILFGITSLGYAEGIVSYTEIYNKYNNDYEIPKIEDKYKKPSSQPKVIYQFNTPPANNVYQFPYKHPLPKYDNDYTPMPSFRYNYNPYFNDYEDRLRDLETQIFLNRVDAERR